MRWFGSKWKGEVCNFLPHGPTPRGDCCFCRQPIRANSRGFTFDSGSSCHKKCLSRAVVGRTWVDHAWERKRWGLWDSVWECKRCGSIVTHDPATRDGREKNRRERGVGPDCLAELVDSVSKF